MHEHLPVCIQFVVLTNLKAVVIVWSNQKLVRDSIQVDGSFQQLLELGEMLFIMRNAQDFSIPARKCGKGLK